MANATHPAARDSISKAPNELELAAQLGQLAHLSPPMYHFMKPRRKSKLPILASLKF